MFKYSFLIVIIICWFTILSGCSSWKDLTYEPLEREEEREEKVVKLEEDNILNEVEINEVAKNNIQKQIASMTLKEKIGQMMIVGLEGYILNEQTKEMIDTYHTGGILVLGGNIKETNQLLNLVNSIKRYNLNHSIPLFFGVDEEGGRVSRVPKEFKSIPSSQHIGEINNEEISFKVGSVLAKKAKAFGFNMNFAPVLDVNSNPNNPVIGDRSFGSDTGIVSSLGIQTMKGIQSENMIPVFKHFPGHGDTSVDSHIGLPLVEHDLNRLQSFELVPFIQAINNEADAVMTAHILLPEVDPDHPATMSKAILTDLLRDQLNFKGVIMTDDMGMGAIIKNYDIGDAAVQAVVAGVDIVMVAHTYDNQVAVMNALYEAVQAGRISEERINESVYRILTLKQKYNIADEEIGSIHVKELNEEIDRVLELLK